MIDVLTADLLAQLAEHQFEISVREVVSLTPAGPTSKIFT